MGVDIDEQVLSDACATVIPSASEPDALLASVSRVIPEAEFHLGKTRSGWYRIGGVVDAHNNRVADDLRVWAENEAGGDVTEFALSYGDAGLKATRVNGKTHFLIAPVGRGTMDYIQVEVEECEEVVDRELFATNAPDLLPDDIEDLIDPASYEPLSNHVITPARYRLRRVTDFSRVPIEAEGSVYGDKLFRRFISEWSDSSASSAAEFHKEWLLTLLPYTDRFAERRYDVKPIPLIEGGVYAVDSSHVRRGVELARFIEKIDRAVGYPMAWYFLLVTNKGVSHQLAQAVHADLMGAYAYLPARDLKVLRDWNREPYNL